jgi:hypothetical protein
MANKVDDSQANKKGTPTKGNGANGNQTSPGNSSYTRKALDRGDLRNAENKDSAPLNQSRAGGNTDAHGASSKTSGSTDTLGGSSKTGGSSGLNKAPSSNTSSFYSPGNDAGENKFYNPQGDNRRFGGVRTGAKKSGQKLKRALKNKWVIGGLVGGGGAVVGLIFLLVLLFGSLELPDVMQHIEAYEFARVTRQFSQSAERVSEEALQVEAATEGSAADGATAANPGGFYGYLKDTYGNMKANVNDLYSGIRSNTWGKLDAFRPSQVIKNLGDTNDLTLRFRTSSLTGRKILTGGSVKVAGIDQSFDVEPLSGLAKWTPGLRAIIKTRNLAQFYSNFLPAVSEAEKANSTSLLVRGAGEAYLIKATNGNAAGWLLSKFVDSDSGNGNETAAKNDAEQMDETYDNTQAGFTAGDNATTGELQAADSAAEQSEDNDMQKLADGSYDYNDYLDYHLGNDWKADDSDPYTNYIQTIIDDHASTSAESALTPSLTETVEADANPLSGLAIPVCIIYDGSVQRSGPTINNQADQQQDAFTALAAEADEQEAGGPPNNTQAGSLAAAIGATHDQLGDISQSNPEILADGGTINTSITPSAEAGSDGGYNFSIFNALTGISPSSLAGKIVSGIVGSTCGALTNTYVLAGGGIVNIAGIILTAGTAEAAEEAAGQSARGFVQEFATNAASNIASQLTKKVVVRDGVEEVTQGALNRFGHFVFDQGITIGKILGATELAHMIVASRAGIVNNGASQGTSLTNEAMCGANIQAGENERHSLFGRPLTASELVQSNAADSAFVAYQNQSKSFTQRYLSPSNADSLTSHMALALDSESRNGIAATFFHLVATILNPMDWLGPVISTLDGSVLAAPNPSTQDCGDIQFGWSQAEESLIDSNQSYRPLLNAKVVSDSGEEPAIALKYAKCFGYSSDSAGDLTSDITTDGSLGNLLADDDMHRDSSGNVEENGGDCSPESLGVNNNAYGPQMVFRWRLAEQYDLTLDQMLDAQTISSTAAGGGAAGGAGGAGGGTPAPSSGTAQQLAVQILSNHNIDLSYSPSVLQDVQDAAAGKPGTAGAMTSAALLNLIETIGKTHTVSITAIQSDGQGHCNNTPKSACPDDPHYNGDAVDFGSLDGVTITGRNPPAITIMKIAFNQLPSGSGFGQNECGPIYSTNSELPNGDITFNDTCNHLHVQVPKGTP